MKSEIFDGGGSFENLFWTGQDSSREAPRSTTDQRMEITEEPEKEENHKEKKHKADKKKEGKKDSFVLSQGGEPVDI